MVVVSRGHFPSLAVGDEHGAPVSHVPTVPGAHRTGLKPLSPPQRRPQPRQHRWVKPCSISALRAEQVAMAPQSWRDRSMSPTVLGTGPGFACQ